MIYALSPDEYDKVRPLAATLGEHLAVRGQVHVDDRRRPTAAFLGHGYRFYLAGAPHNEAFHDGVRRLFTERIYPQALAGDRERPMFTLAYAPGWGEIIPAILQGKHPISDQRQYYLFQQLKNDWRSLLPPGFQLRAADRQLLAEEQLANLDGLQAEMCSERESVEDFLQHSLGCCLVHGEALVSWALSEYNSPAGCDIGLETQEPYRRQGLATIVASATVEQALRQGIPRIGWDCWASNTASQATARKVGFEKAQDYPVYFAWFDETDNLAVNGNVRLRSQDCQGAIPWFERALRSGQAKAWVYLRAACAYALAGRPDDAMDTLRRGVARGLSRDWIRGAEELQSLHDLEGWTELIS